MNKKIVLIIIIIILIGLVSGLIAYFAAPKAGMKSCEEINEELYNYVLAIKNQDITYCGNTGNPKFCKAHVMKDTAFCDTQEDKEYCLAIITSNEKFCAENDWWCKADASKNIEYCNKLPPKEQEECKAEISLNEQYYKQEGLC
ncbi:hypothetical protein JW851_00430 [Candidatus Woesearchaeota archaeon]|nr:hypothetical protein [Candidatus Woesearchaeota archaeon]